MWTNASSTSQIKRSNEVFTFQTEQYRSYNRERREVLGMGAEVPIVFALLSE